MLRYLVEWQIEVDAASPREAAQKALEIQRDPTSLATVFDVQSMEQDKPAEWVTHKIDLEEPETEAA